MEKKSKIDEKIVLTTLVNVSKEKHGNDYANANIHL